MHAVRLPGLFRAVLFTGTCGLDEWRENFRIGADGVHEGWARIYDACCVGELGEEEGREPLWVFGYSMGAALALIHAARTRAAVAAVYTFGSPRVGNRAFAAAVERRVAHHRVVNASDWVADFPSEASGFHHSGRAWNVDFRDIVFNHTLVMYSRNLAHGRPG